MKKKKSKVKHKTGNYVVSYSQQSLEKEILIILRAVGKYIYDSSDKLLKLKPETTKWEWLKEES